MSREIKFRFWYGKPDDKSKLFHQVFTLDEIAQGYAFDVLNDNPMLKDYRMLPMRDQYICMKDAAGMEIYEGDQMCLILGSRIDHDERFIGTIEWVDDGEFLGPALVCENGSYDGIRDFPAGALIIAGNIHQNHELLNK